MGMDLIIFAAGMVPGMVAGEWMNTRFNRQHDWWLDVISGPTVGMVTGLAVLFTVIALR